MDIIKKLQKLPEAKQKEIFVKLLGEEEAKKLFPEGDTFVGELMPGDKFDYGNISWVVLDSDKDGVLCLSEKIVFVSRMCEKQDKAVGFYETHIGQLFYKWSVLRDEPIFAFQDLPREGLVLFNRSDRAEDGSGAYCQHSATISLLTTDEYRKYRKIIPKAEFDNWWTLTKPSVDSILYVYIGQDGCLFNLNAFDSAKLGVRPLIKLKHTEKVTRRNK